MGFPGKPKTYAGPRWPNTVGFPGFTATLEGRWPDEEGALFRFTFSDDPHALMERHGLEVPHSLRPHPGTPHHRRLRARRHVAPSYEESARI